MYSHNDPAFFVYKDAKIEQPAISENNGCAIAFVPSRGFCWCQYSNGSKTWRIPHSGESVEVTFWLKNIPTGQIQLAHDVLHQFVAGELPIAIPDQTQKMAHAALDVLCWILDHPSGETFKKNMDDIYKTLHDMGYQLKSTES